MPPLDRLKFVFFVSYFVVGGRFWTCLTKLAYRFLNIAGDQRMCVVSIRKCGPQPGRFVEMRHEKFLLLPPPH